jgi:hypothetical protein
VVLSTNHLFWLNAKVRDSLQEMCTTTSYFQIPQDLDNHIVNP